MTEISSFIAHEIRKPKLGLCPHCKHPYKVIKNDNDEYVLQEHVFKDGDICIGSGDKTVVLMYNYII